MRKPIKPFAVETRRTGRKPVGPGASFGSSNPFGSSAPFSSGAVPPRESQAQKPQQPEWPPMPSEDDTSFFAAMRAADALFSRPAPAPEPVEESLPEPASPWPASPQAPAEPPRRILQSLNEDDHISRLLAEEEEHRPKRGRKPRAPGEPAPIRLRLAVYAPAAPPPQPEPATPTEPPASSGVIKNYVRGLIFARYARHSEPRPGEQWRKRGVKPLW